MSALLILVRDRPGAPPPPESSPLGRAALTLEAEGVAVVMGGTVEGGVARGLRAVRGGWRPAEAPVDSAHDRFPGWTWPGPWQAALSGLGSTPLGNPRWLTELTRDKLACQRALEDAGVRCPEVVEGDFEAALGEWGEAFVKPRHGSLGRGVELVRRGDVVPLDGPGAGTVERDPNLLQRAILRDEPVALRVVLQREGSGWVPLPVVARRSADPVVNVERGATAALARDVLPASAVDASIRLARDALAALLGAGEATHAVELGLDVVLDRDDRPWLIEVNPVPRGRLRVLAARSPALAAAHAAASLRPLRALLAR